MRERVGTLGGDLTRGKRTTLLPTKSVAKYVYRGRAEMLAELEGRESPPPPASPPETAAVAAYGS